MAVLLFVEGYKHCNPITFHISSLLGSFRSSHHTPELLQPILFFLPISFVRQSMRPSNLHPIFLHLGHCGWSHVSSCHTRLPEIPGVQAQVTLGYCQPHHRILQRGVRGGLFYSLDPTSPSVLLQQSGNPPCVWGLSVPSSTEFIFLISMTRVPSGDCGHPARGREERRDGYCMPVLSKIPEIEKIFVFLPWQEDQNVNSCPVLGNHCQG